MTATFLDWDDRNSHAAAECAIRKMAEGYSFEDAVEHCCRTYSASKSAVVEWVKRLGRRS